MVGFCPILQHTPLFRTGELPSEAIIPPLSAVVEVMFFMEVVVIVGNIGRVVKLIASAYDVPTELIA